MKYNFTFIVDQDLELNADQASKFLGFFGCKSSEEIDDLLPTSMRPDPEAAKEFGDDPEYEKMDAMLLPHLWLEVFADNFSNPELIFKTTPKIFLEDLTKKDIPDILDVRVEQLTCDAGDEGLSICLNILATVRLDIVDGVKMEDGEDPNKEIDAQIYECKNMCNFGFREIDIENDEALSHDWEAIPSVSN